MSGPLWLNRPLRLPSGRPQPEPRQHQSARDLFDDLAVRAFNGRVEVQSDSLAAEFLLRDGQILAAATAEGKPGPTLSGAAALAALLERSDDGWSFVLEALEVAAVAALAGLGAPAVTPPAASDDLRGLLRDLAGRAETGVLEVRVGASWARILLASGRVLGAYSEAEPELVATLELLGNLPPAPDRQLCWQASTRAEVLALPPDPSAESGKTAEVERAVWWVVSRFEGAWGRARERADLVDGLQAAAVEMLASLRALAAVLEAHPGDDVALRAMLDSLTTAPTVPRRLADVDPRLAGVSSQQTWPTLVALVGEALGRIVAACPEPGLATCCRQAAGVLDAELRSALPDRPVAAPRAGVGSR